LVIEKKQSSQSLLKTMDFVKILKYETNMVGLKFWCSKSLTLRGPTEEIQFIQLAP